MDHEEHREEIAVDHPHAFDQEDPKGGLILLIGLGAIVVLVVSGLAVQFYYERFKEDQFYKKVMISENDALVNLRATEARELSTYGLADAQKGIVRIPLDRAMQLYIQEAAAGKTRHPVTPYAVKTPEQIAAAAAVPPAAAGAPQQTGAPAPPPAKPNAKPSNH